MEARRVLFPGAARSVANRSVASPYVGIGNASTDPGNAATPGRERFRAENFCNVGVPSAVSSAGRCRSSTTRRTEPPPSKVRVSSSTAGKLAREYNASPACVRKTTSESRRYRKHWNCSARRSCAPPSSLLVRTQPLRHQLRRRAAQTMRPSAPVQFRRQRKDTRLKPECPGSAEDPRSGNDTRSEIVFDGGFQWPSTPGDRRRFAGPGFRPRAGSRRAARR